MGDMDGQYKREAESNELCGLTLRCRPTHMYHEDTIMG
jgi:hypothetical protein